MAIPVEVDNAFSTLNAKIEITQRMTNTSAF